MDLRDIKVRDVETFMAIAENLIAVGRMTAPAFRRLVAVFSLTDEELNTRLAALQAPIAAGKAIAEDEIARIPDAPARAMPMPR